MFTTEIKKEIKELNKTIIIYSVYVAYKIENNELEDVRIFTDGVEAHYFLEKHPDYRIWQRPIE